MSYIRTKDNVYEVYAREKCPNGCVITTSGVKVPYMDVLYDSDDVKELLDGYYLDIDNRPFESAYLYNRNELDRAFDEKISWQNYSDRKYLGYEINLYAFIKTDKGLVFVAKINEKEKPDYEISFR